METKEVRMIPPKFQIPKPYQRVGIYCRVSTVTQEQLHSMSNQVSFYVQMLNNRNDWRLVDAYLDFKSGKDIDHRLEFMRMIKENDVKKQKEMLELSLLISKLMEEGRMQEGIVFDNDK